MKSRILKYTLGIWYNSDFLVFAQQHQHTLQVSNEAPPLPLHTYTHTYNTLATADMLPRWAHRSYLCTSIGGYSILDSVMGFFDGVPSSSIPLLIKCPYLAKCTFRPPSALWHHSCQHPYHMYCTIVVHIHDVHHVTRCSWSPVCRVLGNCRTGISKWKIA